MATWAEISDFGGGISTNITQRPLPVGTIYDNTTVTGSWVNTSLSNINATYHKHNRLVNQVIMSMPHAGVVAAAHDIGNEILQPQVILSTSCTYERH
jgi:hypothetical protein